MASFLRANTRSRYLEGALAQYGTVPLPIAEARFGVHPISLPLKRRVLAGEAKQPQASPMGTHESAIARGLAEALALSPSRRIAILGGAG